MSLGRQKDHLESREVKSTRRQEQAIRESGEAPEGELAAQLLSLSMLLLTDTSGLL